jgi:phosphate uptake regulator
MQMQEQQVLNQMVALSGKKLEMLTELKKLSEQQRQAFQDNNIAAVEPILNKKDEIIRYVRQLDDAFLKASGTLKEMLGIEKLDDLSKFELAGRNEIKRLIADITDTVESIIKIEQDSYKNVSEMKNEISNRIKSVNTGKKATKAYNIKPFENPSYFFDRKK